MNARLGRLLGTDPAVYDWVEATLLYTQATQGHVSGTCLTAGARALPPKQAERVIMELADGAGLTRQGGRARGGYLADRYVVTDADKLRAALRSAREAAVLLAELAAAEPPQDTFELVATFPEGFPAVADVAPLNTSLQRLVVSATESVVVLIPFFDDQGLDPLADALLARARLGVQVTLIVREVGDSRTVNHRVLKRFAARIREAGVAERFSMYEFEERGADGRLQVTFHAKAILVDGVRAYLGSANLTANGMERFLELGTLLTGPAVAELKAIVSEMLRADYRRRVKW